MSHRSLTLAALAAAVLPAQAAISVGSSAFSYSQSFDSLASTGTANAWVNDSTLLGWSLFNNAGAAVSTYRAGTGSTNNGAIYSFGSADATDRALGGVGSGSFSGWIAAAFANTGAAAYDSFTIRFDGEQWRDGGNTTPAAQTMALQYGFGNSFGAVGSWTAAGAAFNFSSPIFTSTAGAINGNAAGLVSGLGSTVTTNWTPSQTLWLRWAEVNDSGNDHGLAIDNLQFSVTSAVPETGTWALLLAGLALVGVAARRRA